jgi:hypothetical protein
MHPGCLQADGRPTSVTHEDDLSRHMQRHSPHRQLYPCSVGGCKRGGENGLPRRDKLLEHMREVHKFGFDNSAPVREEGHSLGS